MTCNAEKIVFKAFNFLIKKNNCNFDFLELNNYFLKNIFFFFNLNTRFFIVFYGQFTKVKKLF